MKYSLLLTGSILLLAGNADALQFPHPTGSIGVFNAGTWWLDVDRSFGWSGTGPGADQVHSFGTTGDRPVVLQGQPCGSNLTAVIGVTRGNNWYVTKNDLDYDSAGDDPNAFVFGSGTVTPFSRPGIVVAFYDGVYRVDYDRNHAEDERDLLIPSDNPSEVPLLGNWLKQVPVPNFGSFEPSTGTWHIQLFNPTPVWHFGVTGSDVPVVMPYSDGVDHIGVFSNGNWYMDTNGNHVWDGTAGGDAYWAFGNPNDIPVIAREGSWTGECG